MKTISLLACALALASTLWAEDPFKSAESLLARHAHRQSAAQALTLEQVEQIAMQANPEVRVTARQVAIAEAHIPGAGALEDPSFMYRGWQVPLKQPWNYNSALNMFMLGQSFPGPGKRGLRSEIAGDEVQVAKAELEAKKREIGTRTRKAFYDLLRYVDELRVHDEQVAIARQGLEAARIKYTVGHVPQQDLLKAQVSLTKLVEHLVMIEEDGELARTNLNTLLGRDPASSIEVTGIHEIPAQLPSLANLERAALDNRPELVAVTARIKRSQDEGKLAQKGYTPDYSINLGYMLMPNGSPVRNTYMIEGGVSLPWLNRRKHESEINEAQARLSATKADADAVRSVVFQQIQEAVVRANAAKRLLELYRDNLRPQTNTLLRSTVIAYENDRTDLLNLLDSQNTTVDVDFAYFRALADFEIRMAELELAVGAPIARTTQQASAEVVQ
jgi:outer membrane protein TolC